MSRYAPCYLCIGVSASWLFLQLGIVLGYFAGEAPLTLTALLMGTSVMGIASMGEKRLEWLAAHPLWWKLLMLCVGIPAAYLALRNLSLITIALELIVLIAIGSILFRRNDIGKDAEPKAGDPRTIKNMLKNCC